MAVKTALITGANTGIGLSLAERLLQQDPSMHLCLACRNKSKAEAARGALLVARPEAQVSILLVDISDLGSVYKAAAEIRKRFNHLDYLYLNAGIMPAKGINWSAFIDGLFKKNLAYMFRTGDGILKQEDGTTKDGLRQTFATNLFGHYVLIKQLDDVLGVDDRTTQIVWTSSSNANKAAFCLDDVQHSNGNEPYASSKYACDMLSVALSERLHKQGVYSHTTCPGLVMTNLTYGIMPSWIWYLFMPLLWILRLLVPSLTLDAYNGSQVLFWLSQQNPSALDPRRKYVSKVTVTGKPYTDSMKLDIDADMPQQLYRKLEEMEQSFHKKFENSS